MKIETTQAAVDIFGIVCMGAGFASGWLICWRKQEARRRNAAKHYEAAYKRYWAGYNDGEPF